MELTLKERQKLTSITAKKYRKAQKREKSKILDTFVAQTGYARKYAIHILANEGKVKPVNNRLRAKVSQKSRKKRVYPSVYDTAVRDALAPIWMAFSFLCGKLLAPFLHTNIDAIANDPRFPMSLEVIDKLRRISPASIDRLLRKTKAALRIKGTCGTRPAPQHLKALIPTLTHFDCIQDKPGLWQIDLVQHDGGNPSGEFCYTLTITEIRTTWTVHYVLRNKAFKWVLLALKTALTQLPTPVHIFHADNGSEFINVCLLTWCKEKGIALTRSRTKRKNDNCFVEQKNAHTVRKVIGYGRYCGDAGVTAIQDVYTHSDRLRNFFYPNRKLISKERVGSTLKKKYDKPQSPFERILAEGSVAQELKQQLIYQKTQLDLMAEMRLMNQALDKLCSSAVPVPQFVHMRGKPLHIKPQG